MKSTNHLSPRERLVLVHPHTEYDGSGTIAEYSRLRLATFTERTESVLVLQGINENSGMRARTDELLPIYVDRALGFPRINSLRGEIGESTLEILVKSGVTINLLGGIVGQCHREAFLSIAQFIDKSGATNITISIPFDGCYLKHGRVEWGDGPPPFKFEHCFDGVPMMGGHVYEMGGSDSYTLREIALKVFATPNRFLHHLQVRDQQRRPLVATSTQFRENLVQHFLSGYFRDRDGKPQFIHEHQLHFGKDELRIVFS